MCSVSRSEINQQFGRYKNVSVWGFSQQTFPIPLWDRVIPAPLSSPLFWHPEIGSHLLPTPRFHNFTKTIHNRHSGVFHQEGQGVDHQCFFLLNRGKYPL